jgi:hypothetical protein
VATLTPTFLFTHIEGSPRQRSGRGAHAGVPGRHHRLNWLHRLNRACPAARGGGEVVTLGYERHTSAG